MNNSDKDMEMVDVSTSSDEELSDAENGGSLAASDVDSEYGERTLEPVTVTKGSAAERNEFYQTTVRRQNTCFGVSMLTVAGLFMAAYFLMGLSFSPSNIGIFGDESAMKGSSGEVGLDADNAETQEIVDEEITELEVAGQWGEEGEPTPPKRAKAPKNKKDKPRDKHGKERWKDFAAHNKVGENQWVENKDWWKKNADKLDPHKLTKSAKKRFKEQQKHGEEGISLKRLQKKCHKRPNLPVCASLAGTDLDAIKQKLADHYNYEETGGAKESFPRPPRDGPDQGKKGRTWQKHHGKDKQKHKGKDVFEKDPHKPHAQAVGEEGWHQTKHVGEDEGSDNNEGDGYGASEEVKGEADTNESLPGEESDADSAGKDVEENSASPKAGDADAGDEEEDVEAGDASGAGGDEVGDADAKDLVSSSESGAETAGKDAEEDSGPSEGEDSEGDSEGAVDIPSGQEDGAGGESVNEKDANDGNALPEGDNEPPEEGDAQLGDAEAGDAEVEQAEIEEAVAEDVEAGEAEPPEPPLLVPPEPMPSDEAAPTEEDTQKNMIVNTFTVLEQVKHDPTSFTQGLSYGQDGKIYESTGLYRHSKMRRINEDTFEVEKSTDTDGKYFGEGSTYFTDDEGKGKLIEITWKEQTGFIIDPETLEQLEEFKYTTTRDRGNEGWGISYMPNSKEFVVSDGSAYLYFWDRDSKKETRKVKVTRFDGSEQDQLNELEYMDGLVCCNIWHEDDIICVDPQTGKSVKEYDMSSLWPASERGGWENVLNGIALAKDHVLLTGKRWDRMYKVTWDDWPTLFRN